MIKLFAVSIIVLQVFAHVRTDQIALFRYLEFIVLSLYINKVVVKKKKLLKTFSSISPEVA